MPMNPPSAARIRVSTLRVWMFTSMVLPEPKPPNSEARLANAMVSGNPRMVRLTMGISSVVRASSFVRAPMNTPRENATKK